jgi:outer membrane protein insertion porin family
MIARRPWPPTAPTFKSGRLLRGPNVHHHASVYVQDIAPGSLVSMTTAELDEAFVERTLHRFAQLESLEAGGCLRPGFVEKLDHDGGMSLVELLLELTLAVERSTASAMRRLHAPAFGTVEEVPGSAPDRTVLNVNVEEQPTGSFQIGGGASSNDNFIFNVSVEQRNLLGRGQYVLLDLQAAQRTKQARLSITEPRFLGRQLRAGASVFYNATDFEEAGFVSDTVGFNLNAGFPASEFSSLLLNYGLRYDNVEFPTRRLVGENAEGEFEILTNASTAEATAFELSGVSLADLLIDPDAFDVITAIPADEDGDGILDTAGVIRTDSCNLEGQQVNFSCARNGEFVTSQLGYTFRMDKTNDPIVPSRGYDFTISQSFAGLGGDVNFHRTTVRAGTYRRLPFNLIGSLKFNGGYVDSFDDTGVRINDRFFLGGNRIIRGFDVAGVGPRLFTAGASGRAAERGQSIGARAYAVGTAEALLPLPIPPSYGIRASLFVDGGFIGLANEAEAEVFNSDPSFSNFFGDPVPTFQEQPELFTTELEFELDEINPATGLPFQLASGQFDDDGNALFFTEEGTTFLATDIFDDPLQDDLAPRLVAGVSINWNSPFGPIQIDISEAFIAEEFDRPQGFRFSAGGRF